MLRQTQWNDSSTFSRATLYVHMLPKADQIRNRMHTIKSNLIKATKAAPAASPK